MPTIKKPLNVFCFQCQANVLIKFVAPRKDYSKKNDWYYWTEKEEYKDKYICDKCLRKLYKKQKWYFLEKVQNLDKCQLLRNYINARVIMGR